MKARDRTYTTLLMATGLIFGSIAALYGLTNHLISQRQYSVLVTVVFFGLGGLAAAAHSEAVLPAYLIGHVVAGVFRDDRIIVDRLRTIAFALLTPFFFLRAGLLISFPALWAGLGGIAALFAVKMLTKVVAVWRRPAQ
jgi:Kef-type K+ transport system membrane component KefB